MINQQQHSTTAFPEPTEWRGVEFRARHVSFAEAFRFWVKLGFISFGGPAGQIAIMHRELVERRRWLGEERFLHALNYCMMLPGPEAQQLAIYVGWLMHRTWGGIVAGVFFVIPSVFILLVLSYVYAAYGNLPAVAGVLSGFKPIVVAVVVEAALKIGKRALKRRTHFIVAAAAFVAIYFFHFPFPLIVVAAGIVGLVSARLWSQISPIIPAQTNKGAHNLSIVEDHRHHLPLAIDDDAPPPPHTLPSRQRILRTLLAGLVLWAVPLFTLAAWRGWDSLHAQQYRFFTKAALVTFGGAYAVLAYVTQAVTRGSEGSAAWLTQTQAIDGLALAESTPGPLIMVLQFVGFMAGWNHPQELNQITSAVTGALVTTYATFLPCFLFILVGAPYIEVVRGNKNLTGALSGITAALVGVILNLAIVFGVAVIWPRGLSSAPDLISVALGVAAFVVLYRFKTNILWVVLAGGLIGLARVLVAP
ncbi:MAG TPA: chromate efflux transporter [Pyrinomonadaceae bacterium]|nr:chromate efflux transporter [Pyrinomonadaceae bacterium]